jgi:hypothetical protein
MSVIKLVVGDWSKDGHNQSDDVYVKVSFKDKGIHPDVVKDVEKAYKEGSKKLGFDLVKDCCCDYEDNGIEQHFAKKLQEQRVVSKDYFSFNKDLLTRDGKCCLDDGPDTFADLYMSIAKFGNPAIEWDFFELEEGEIKIGGYGLYY